MRLCRDCFSLGDYEVAVRYFVELIAGTKITPSVHHHDLELEPQHVHTQSAERQSTFLKEFLFVVKVRIIFFSARALVTTCALSTFLYARVDSNHYTAGGRWCVCVCVCVHASRSGSSSLC